LQRPAFAAERQHLGAFTRRSGYADNDELWAGSGAHITPM
jgi:hypothetical protein